MREIVVISGKGGTGKRPSARALPIWPRTRSSAISTWTRPTCTSCLIRRSTPARRSSPGNEAVIDRDACRRCGICFEHCRFDAVKKDGDVYGIDPLRCEGCGVCVALCPAKAIAFPEKECGEWYVSDTRFGPFVHAQLLSRTGKFRRARDPAQTAGPRARQTARA